MLFKVGVRQIVDKRVGIVGLGLIGGSLGLTLRRKNWHVTGYDLNPSVGAVALERGAVDLMVESPEELASGCSFLLGATPTTRIAGAVLSCARSMQSGGTITDCGSVKAPVLQDVSRRLPDGINFIGGHPMAGSEKRSAFADLFSGAKWALSGLFDRPASAKAWELVENLVIDAGAVPLMIDACEHDRAVAFTSHLPYAVSVALSLACAMTAGEVSAVRQLHAGGFRDMTRIARGVPPQVCDQRPGCVGLRLCARLSLCARISRSTTRWSRQIAPSGHFDHGIKGVFVPLILIEGPHMTYRRLTGTIGV